ncbi:MAG: NUDIX domain-containing protein [Pseudomonadota bacterium]
MPQVKQVSAGIVLVKRGKTGWNFLLLRSFDVWDFPKGGIEQGEDPLQAAIREVEEETTITDLEFLWGYDYIDTHPYRGGSKIARYYVALTRQKEISLPINPQLGRPEHEEYRWLNYHEAYPILTTRVRRVLRWARGVIEGIPE